MDFHVTSSVLLGHIDAPSSKSHSMRAILFASLARGKSYINNYLISPDTQAMLHACRKIGAKIRVSKNCLEIDGVAGKVGLVDDVLDVGNSGQVLRFIAAITALGSDYVVLTGDYSIRYNRPMQPLIDGLNGLGAFCISTKNDGFAPIVLRGPISSGVTTIFGEDSQPVSALIIAATFLQGKTEIYVKNPGEKPWIDLTLSWLDRFGVKYENDIYRHYTIYGNVDYGGFDYTVPCDFSSILFPIVAALITKSEIALHNVDMNDVQGDKKVITVLREMGANIEYNNFKQILKVNKTEYLTGIDIDANNFIDAVPILAVVGCYARGKTKINNIAIARAKECDRITCITKELNKMGAQIREFTDSILIHNSKLRGERVLAYSDHRIAMSLCVAALNAEGKTVVVDSDCYTKSYSEFCKDMNILGANIKIKS